MQTIPVRQFPRRLTHCAVALFCLLAAIGVQAAGKAPVFPRYRDLKVYTTSAPDAKNPAKIIARTQFVNDGKTAVRIGAKLNASRILKIAGGKFAGSIPAGKSADWTWSFPAPAGLTREVLTGSIDINGRRERDLFISVLGPDPADMNDGGVEKITEKARVVATYAPRTQRSILAEQAYLKAHQPRPILTVAAAGQTTYSIVAPVLPTPPPGQDTLAYWKGAALTDPQKELVEALDDLQRCVKLQSGTTLPVTTQATGPAIRLRQVDLGEAAKGLNDAYRLRTDGQDIIIEAGSLESLRNGIYGLLTDHLDCHWFQPRELGEEIIIPKDHTVRLPALNEMKGSPWFGANGASFGHDRRWDRRNRGIINRCRMGFGHSWGLYINKSEFPYDKFPEYYARDRQGNILICDPPDAGTFTNFCSTNPDVLAIVAKKVNAYFAANPDAIVTSLDPNDYAPLCQCDRCLALDKSYGQTKEDASEVTDRLLHFSKEIYDRLDPKYKDKYLGILIYGMQMQLPKSAKPHAHHAGMICDQAWTYDHTRPWNDPTSAFNRPFYELIKGWGALLPQLGYYDYYGAYISLWGVIHKMREDLPAFHDLGGTYLMLEAQPMFATQGLNLYIANQFNHDIDVDVDLAMDEFFQKYYGPVAQPMRDYWLGIERRFALERPCTNNIGSRPSMHADFWEELDVPLRQAGAMAATLPAEDKRFADRVKQAVDGFNFVRFNYNYEDRYGRDARRRGTKIDDQAAIDFLTANRAIYNECLKKYTDDSSYWPVILPSYFFSEVDVDMRINKHKAALKQNG